MSLAAPESAYDHQECAALRSDADGPSATQRARVERSTKGWSVESVLKMAGDAGDRPACGLLRIEPRGDRACWTCRCGAAETAEAAGGKVEDAYQSYMLHRQGTAYWRAHVLSIMDEGAEDTDGGTK